MCCLWYSIVQVSMLKTCGYGHITDGNKLVIACSYYNLYIIQFSYFYYFYFLLSHKTKVIIDVHDKLPVW